MKDCKDCGIPKEHEAFHRNKSMKDGRLNSCKSCVRDYKAENKGKIRDYQSDYSKRYREANKEAVSASKRKYKKSPTGKLAIKINADKYQNAKRSRAYYNYHKHKITPLSHCQKCSSNEIVEAHHLDYDYPMTVEYLCNTCHVEWHKENTPLNRETGIFTKGRS